MEIWGKFTLDRAIFVKKSNSLVQGSKIIIYPLVSANGDVIDGWAERCYDDGVIKESFMMDTPIKGSFLFFDNDLIAISTDSGLKIRVDISEIRDFALLAE